MYLSVKSSSSRFNSSKSDIIFLLFLSTGAFYSSPFPHQNYCSGHFEFFFLIFQILILFFGLVSSKKHICSRDFLQVLFLWFLTLPALFLHNVAAMSSLSIVFLYNVLYRTCMSSSKLYSILHFNKPINQFSEIL